MDRRKKVLVDALDDDDEHVRATAAEALERLDMRERMPVFERNLATGDKVTKLRTIYGISPLRGNDVLRLLVKAVKDPEEDVRAAAVRELGNHGDTRVLSTLVEALGDESPVVRRVAVEAITRFREPKLLGYLMKMLKDRDPGVIERALEAIGRLGDKRAEEAMIYFTRKGRPAMKSLALKALGLMEI
ncbi:MAG TPA: HEAT repeat domain-containing protein [Deltaproteobacteria bacterium]|nr:HEAT repeat domain-containing protein [Deltaproteobacteria bacterium]